MDFYFTDRKFNLIEIASTDGQAPYQLSVAADLESINASARTFAGTLVFTKEQANRVSEMAALGNYVLFHDKQGKDVFMTIMDIRHDPLNGTHDFTAENAGVDLINETIGAYAADKAYNIAYYIKKFTADSGFEIGVNEISTLTRKLKWDSTDETALARVLSIATQFDAELAFSFVISGINVVHRYINIYKHRGSDKQIRLYLDKDINNIITSGDIYGLYTSVYATGGTPEGKDTPINLKGYKWIDADGRYELGTDGILRDTVAVQLWSRLLSNDNPNPIKSHIQRSKIYEATTQASLLQSALGGLKKAANPAINYEVDIAVLPDNVTVGDTVHIVDDNEDLYLSARVLELKYDYALEQYTATLGDYLIEHDQVSSDLRELADQVKNMPKVVQYYPWVRYADDADGNGFSMFPQDKAYMAVIYGMTSTPSDNPSDYAGKWQRVVGPNGQDGADGIVGPAGEAGQTSYFHRAYANSLDGKTDFSVTDGNGKSYMGTYSDFFKADSTDPTKYNWALFKGPQGVKGEAGVQGLQGPKGDQGIKGPAGADGKSSYTHIAYGTSNSGAGFTQTPSTSTTYIGMYVDQTATDSTDPKKYAWSLIKGADGAQGTPGKAGADGKTPYFHQAWADSQDGKTNFSTTSSLGKKYLGTYTDFISADSTDPTKYAWTELVGAIETGQRNLVYNSEYDNNAEGWNTTNGYITNAPGSMYQGSLGWAINSTGDSWIQFAQSKPYKLPNTSSTDVSNVYSMSAMIKIYNDTTIGAGAGVTLAFLNSAGSRISGWKDNMVYAATGTTNVWIQIKFENMRVPEGAVSVVLQYEANRKTGGKVHAVIAHPMLTFGPVIGNYNKDVVGQSDINKAEDNANKHTDDAINNLIPSPSSGISYPSNPKKGQQHWLTDANSKPKGLFQYDGSKWVAVPVNADTISANTLNGMTINGVTINGSTINSPNINVPFNNVPANPDEPANSPYAQLVSGTTQLTSNLKISANLTDGTNKTAQWLRTLVSPQGFSNIISTPDASKALSQIDISFGSMFLSEWHDDVTANDGFVSSYFGAGDAATYERKDTIKDTANFKGAVIRYSRKGTQVNVGFSFTLLSDTGWIGLSAIPKGYTPASLASVGITCPSLSYRGYFCIVYPNGNGWRLIPTAGQGSGGFQGTVSYVTYDDYPYNDATN